MKCKKNIFNIFKNMTVYAMGLMMCSLSFINQASAQSQEFVDQMVDYINQAFPLQNGNRQSFDYSQAQWQSEEQKKAFMQAAMKTNLKITGMGSKDKKLYENLYNSQKKDVSKSDGFTAIMNEVLDNTKQDVNIHNTKSQSYGYDSSYDVANDRLKEIMGESGGSALLKTTLHGLGKSSDYTSYDSYVYAYKELEEKLAPSPIGGYTTGSSFEKEDVVTLAKRANDALNTMLEKGLITEEEYIIEKDRITNLVQKARADVMEQINQLDISEEAKLALKERTNEVVANIGECSSIQYIKDKYMGSGCWACLVVERLTSSFLNAASKAYSLAQKAGLIALTIGSVLWVLLWGMKNVSSFSQIDAPNVLNDLIKFGFKVLLAYLFIISGLVVVREYIITPLMGTGAVVGEQFWTGQLSEVNEKFVWDDVEEEELIKVVQEAEKEHQEEIKKNQETTLVTTPEEQALFEASRQLELKENAKSDIPSFITPGVSGVITSYPGCRKPPKTATGYGSASHMGLDIGGNNMQPIKAIAGGTIYYSGDERSGWGLKAVITTKHKGNTWIHLYGHMNPKTYSDLKSKLNGREVVQGQQIGNVGTTGNSSGPHLHLEVQLTGKVGEYNYRSTYLDPISLGQGKIVPRAFSYDESTKTFTFNKKQCKGQQESIPDTGYPKGSNVPASGFSSSGKAGLDLSSTYIMDGSGYDGDSTNLSLQIQIPDVTYTGPSDIMKKNIMDNIIRTTKVITDNTSENLVLGDAIMCYAKTPGGRWAKTIPILGVEVHMTNWWMWLQGALIWATGFLLTLAVAYYLVDISFKVGFAVIALPIVVGLWPFKLTSGKFTNCISIIAKAAATYAFLGITTYFAIKLVAYNFATDGSGNLELSQTYTVVDCALGNPASCDKISMSEVNTEDPSDYLAKKLQLFSISFIILMFCLIYSFMIVQQTTSKIVNKFFPDNVFGDVSPMHHNATAATKAVKDLAMKPVKWAGDVATYQGTKLIGRTVRRIVNSAKSSSRGGGDGGSTGRTMQKGGRAIKKGGQALNKVGSALNKTKFGAVIGVPLQAAGKVTQAAGAVVEQGGKIAEKAGKKIKKAREKMKKSLSRIGKRRGRSEG